VPTFTDYSPEKLGYQITALLNFQHVLKPTSTFNNFRMSRRINRFWLENLEKSIFSENICGILTMIENDSNCLIRMKFIKYFWQKVREITAKWDLPREASYMMRETWITRCDSLTEQKTESYAAVGEDLIKIIGPALKMLLQIPRMKEKFKAKFSDENDYKWENILPIFKKNKNRPYNEIRKSTVVTVFDYVLKKGLPELIEESQKVMEILDENLPDLVQLDEYELSMVQVITANAMASYNFQKLEELRIIEFP